MSLPGKYLFYEEENFIQLFKSNGIELESLVGKKYTLDITQDGNKYSIVRTIGDDRAELNFTLNEKFNEDLFGKQFEAIATLENNVLKISTTEDRRRYYNVTDEGLEVVFKSPKGEASLRYKRI